MAVQHSKMTLLHGWHGRPGGVWSSILVHVTGSKKTVKTYNILHGQFLESVPCARCLGVDIFF